MTIKTLAFDFGNVVGHFSHRKASERLAAHSPLSVDVIHRHIFGGQLEDDFESGRLTTSDFLRSVREICQLDCDDEFASQALADMFWRNEEVCALVPCLKPRYRLLLASNTNDLHARHFERQFEQTLAHFDACILSHQVGARKPSAAFFAHCQRLALCAPAECLFIDDLPANVAGARSFGWQGIVYRDYADFCTQLARHGVDVV
jgi:putative hydrolase of the HAD superfamily